MTEIYN